MKNIELDEIYNDDNFDNDLPSLKDAKKDAVKKAARDRFKKIRGRSWFIVSHESSWNDDISYEGLFPYLNEKFGDNLAYVCFNEEVSDAGSKHMHIYIELFNDVTQLRIMNLLPGSHVAKRMGSPSEARLYVEKPEGVSFQGKEKSHTVVKPISEHGDWSRYKDIKARGRSAGNKKSANERINEMVDACSTEIECMQFDAAFFNQYRQTIMPLLNQKLKKKFREDHCDIRISAEGHESVTVNLKVAFLWGGSGVGKTTSVYDKYGYDNVYKSTFKESNGKFFLEFEGYNNEPVILVDEVSPDRFPSIDYMKEFLDASNTSDMWARYANKARLFHTIIFVSNYNFGMFYKNLKDDSKHRESYKAIVRRFTMGIWEMRNIEKIDGEVVNKRVVIDITPYDVVGDLNRHLIKTESPITSSVDVVSMDEYERLRAVVCVDGVSVPF